MAKTAGLLLALIFFSGSSVIFAATSDQYLAAGDQLYQAQDFNKALLYYKAAVQVDPQNWKAYLSLGNCEYSMGDRENAINNFQKSLNINPNNPSLQSFVNQLSQTSTIPVHIVKSLPESGKWIWNLGGAAELLDRQDLISAYAPATFSAPSGPLIGAEFDLGIDYTLSRSFELGVQFQAIAKPSQSVSLNNSGVTQIYSETCVGGVLTAEYRFSLDSKLNLAFHGEGGFYALAGSNLNATNGAQVQTGGLTAADPGGLLAVEFEWVQDDGWALDLGLGYRLLTFTPVNYANSTNGSGGTLINNNGSAIDLDFSGPRFNAAVRFF